MQDVTSNHSGVRFNFRVIIVLILFIPGGLGISEGTMVLVYSSLGVPLALALMSVLVFRFFSFWIWIPFGVYSFFSLKRKR